MSVGEDMYNPGFFRCTSNLEVPFFTPSGLDGLSFTLPNFEGPPFTQTNLIATDYFPGDPTHFATTKDTVTSATSQVGEQANNDLKLRLPPTTATATATATARTDRSSSSTDFNDFWSWVTGPDWSGQPGISTEYGVAQTQNNNNLPIPSTVPVASAITNTPERRKRGRSTISFEQLQQHFGKTRKNAAEDLDVSVSTLNRVARGYGISYWPGPKKNNRVVKKARNYTISSEPDPKKLIAMEASNVIQTSPPPPAELAMQDATRVTFKVDFGGDSVLRGDLVALVGSSERVGRSAFRGLALRRTYPTCRAYTLVSAFAFCGLALRRTHPACRAYTLVSAFAFRGLALRRTHSACRAYTLVSAFLESVQSYNQVCISWSCP
ncbi:hypothetical protein LguiB_001783 [Lonicera macranthoides]